MLTHYQREVPWYIKRHVVTMTSGAQGSICASRLILYIVVKHMIPIIIEAASELTPFDTTDSHQVRLLSLRPEANIWYI